MTDTQTDGHGNSMTDPAQRGESVKIPQNSTASPIKIVPLKENVLKTETYIGLTARYYKTTKYNNHTQSLIHKKY